MAHFVMQTAPSNVAKVRCPPFGAWLLVDRLPTWLQHFGMVLVPIRSALSLDIFKSELKIHLFCQHFNV